MSLYTVLPRAQSFIYFCTCNTPNILDETGMWQQLENPKCDLVSCNFALVVSEQTVISPLFWLMHVAFLQVSDFFVPCWNLDAEPSLWIELPQECSEIWDKQMNNFFFFLILILASTFPSFCV